MITIEKAFESETYVEFRKLHSDFFCCARLWKPVEDCPSGLIIFEPSRQKIKRAIIKQFPEYKDLLTSAEL